MFSLQYVIVQWLLGIFVAAITGAVAAFTPRIRRLLDKHLHLKETQVADQVVDALARLAMAAVEALDQTVVRDAKASGGFNAVLAAKVKQDAVAAVLRHGAAWVTFGYGLLPDVEALVGCLVEQAVSRMRATNPACSVPPKAK